MNQAQINQLGNAQMEAFIDSLPPVYVVKQYMFTSSDSYALFRVRDLPEDFDELLCIPSYIKPMRRDMTEQQANELLSHMTL